MNVCYVCQRAFTNERNRKWTRNARWNCIRLLANKHRTHNQNTENTTHTHWDNTLDTSFICNITWFSPSDLFHRRYTGATTSLSNSAGSSGASDLSRSRSSHALKSRESSPLRSNANASTDGQDGAALSSWARYLKNKYGNRTSKDSREAAALSAPSASTPTSSSSASTSRRLSLGLPLRQANEITSSDDDSKNVQGSPTTTLVYIEIVDCVVVVVDVVIAVVIVVAVLCLLCCH